MNMDRETKIQVADTIIHQLGGGQFLMMTGTHKKALLSGDDLGVAIFVGEGTHNNVALVVIRLDADDTYTLTCRDAAGNDISQSKGLYDDMLQDVFADHTNFYCTMAHSRFHSISLVPKGYGLESGLDEGLIQALIEEIEENPDIYMDQDAQASYEFFCASLHYDAADSDESLPSFDEYIEALKEAKDQSNPNPDEVAASQSASAKQTNNDLFSPDM